MANVTSCSDARTHTATPPPCLTLIGLLASPLIFCSSAFHHTDVYFLAPILSSPLFFSERGNASGNPRIHSIFCIDRQMSCRPPCRVAPSSAASDQKYWPYFPVFFAPARRHTHEALVITSALRLQPKDMAGGLTLQRVKGWGGGVLMGRKKLKTQDNVKKHSLRQKKKIKGFISGHV